MKQRSIILILIVLVIFSCSRDEVTSEQDFIYNPTYVNLNAKLPVFIFNRIQEPLDNRTTLEGIAFGRELFYDPILSADGTQSCGTCHDPRFGFTDTGKKLSVGIDGLEGSRNTQHIVNLGLRRNFFWDGRAKSLEAQAFEPVTNPIEMHNTWKAAAERLNMNMRYQHMSQMAFGSKQIDSVKVVKAIAQFERSLISNNSKYDQQARQPNVQILNNMELAGRTLFRRDREVDMFGNKIISGADCFHCHGEETDFSDDLFHNNGLDMFPTDSGLAAITKDPKHIGLFKTPSLRNLKATGPYMHDGRFQTLDEVIDFYSEGLQYSTNIDPLMKNVRIGGVQLTDLEKQQLKAFLLTLNDDDFLTNPQYGPPRP